MKDWNLWKVNYLLKIECKGNVLYWNKIMVIKMVVFYYFVWWLVLVVVCLFVLMFFIGVIFFVDLGNGLYMVLGEMEIVVE